MTESTLTLWQETALKVRDLQVRFDAFETENKISGNYFNEFDEELEEGRVSLEKLEKRVRELETDLPELIAERVATLKTENTELRVHLNLVVDAVNNITRFIKKTSPLLLIAGLTLLGIRLAERTRQVVLSYC